MINCYLGHKISQQLPYKRYEKLHVLHTSLAVAYEMNAKEQMKLGFRVLSQGSCVQMPERKISCSKKIPFKDTQCADCVNSSLLVDALIVAKVRGFKRRNTENVLNSLCPLGEKDESPSAQKYHGISRRLEWDEKNTGESGSYYRSQS